MHFKVSGKYRLQVVRPDGTVKQEAEFDNLVTDAGLNRMGQGSYLVWCQVGTGSIAPSVSDTALVARVAGSGTTTTSTSGARASAPYYAWALRTFTFSPGTATGNIAEVGVGWSSTGDLFSRALVLDSGGSPTTITVLSDETLYVTYELRYYPPTGDTTGQVTLTGNIGGVYNWTMRAGEVTSSGRWDAAARKAVSISNSIAAYSGTISSITGEPSGTSSSGTMTAQSYVNNSLEGRFNAAFSLSQGNVAGGIRSMRAIIGGSTYQIEFSEDGTGNPIPKTSSDTLNLVIAHSWGRV